MQRKLSMFMWLVELVGGDGGLKQYESKYELTNTILKNQRNDCHHSVIQAYFLLTGGVGLGGEGWSSCLCGLSRKPNAERAS